MIMEAAGQRRQTPKTQEEPAVPCESQDGKTSVAAPGRQAGDAPFLGRGPALWLKQAVSRWEGATAIG